MFCRHGRREDRCIVCLGEKRRAREAAAKKKPAGGKITSARRASSSRSASRSAAVGAVGARRSTGSGSVTVKKLTRHAEDGWSHDLLPGLRSSGEALDLLAHLSRARVRLDRLATDAPGPYATARALAGGEEEDREEATWILFQIAYYGSLEGEEPFREIDRLLVRRADPLPSAEDLAAAAVGPRGAHAHDRGTLTLQGYRDWAARVGGQLRGLSAGGTDPARRFDAAFRALSLPGLGRDARYEFLVTLGAVGLLDAVPWSLLLDAGRDPVSVAAKRAFLTGDAVLLQRRFGAFARALGAAEAALAEAGRWRALAEWVPLRAPIPGEDNTTSNFGLRKDPFTGGRRMHAGMDFRSPVGTPVRTAASGRVVTAGPSGGYGNLVEIDHGHDIVTRYGHLSAIDVAVAQVVPAGAVVGRIGSTGRSTGPHLHYETRLSGAAVDPARFLAAGRRLSGTPASDAPTPDAPASGPGTDDAEAAD